MVSASVAKISPFAFEATGGLLTGGVTNAPVISMVTVAVSAACPSDTS